MILNSIIIREGENDIERSNPDSSYMCEHLACVELDYSGCSASLPCKSIPEQSALIPAEYCQGCSIFALFCYFFKESKIIHKRYPVKNTGKVVQKYHLYTFPVLEFDVSRRYRLLSGQGRCVSSKILKTDIPPNEWKEIILEEKM